MVGGERGGWTGLDLVGFGWTRFDQDAEWNGGRVRARLHSPQGWFYPSTRQRCVFRRTYKSSTRQVTRQEPSTSRQRAVRSLSAIISARFWRVTVLLLLFQAVRAISHTRTCGI